MRIIWTLLVILAGIATAINAAAGSGTTYGTGTVQNPYVSAVAGAGDTVTLTARTTGQSGNLIATTTTIALATLGATLSGGAGRDLTTLGVIPGEASDGSLTNYHTASQRVN